MKYKFVYFFEPFWDDDVTMLIQNFKIFGEWFYKSVIHLKVPFTFSSFN